MKNWLRSHKIALSIAVSLLIILLAPFAIKVASAGEIDIYDLVLSLVSRTDDLESRIADLEAQLEAERAAREGSQEEIEDPAGSQEPSQVVSEPEDEPDETTAQEPGGSTGGSGGETSGGYPGSSEESENEPEGDEGTEPAPEPDPELQDPGEPGAFPPEPDPNGEWVLVNSYVWDDIDYHGMRYFRNYTSQDDPIDYYVSDISSGWYRIKIILTDFKYRDENNTPAFSRLDVTGIRVNGGDENLWFQTWSWQEMGDNISPWDPAEYCPKTWTFEEYLPSPADQIRLRLFFYYVAFEVNVYQLQ